MCISAADFRSAEESMAWDSLCPECYDKAERLLDERKPSFWRKLRNSSGKPCRRSRSSRCRV